MKFNIATVFLTCLAGSGFAAPSQYTDAHAVRDIVAARNVATEADAMKMAQMISHMALDMNHDAALGKREEAAVPSPEANQRMTVGEAGISPMDVGGAAGLPSKSGSSGDLGGLDIEKILKDLLKGLSKRSSGDLGGLDIGKILKDLLKGLSKRSSGDDSLDIGMILKDLLKGLGKRSSGDDSLDIGKILEDLLKGLSKRSSGDDSLDIEKILEDLLKGLGKRSSDGGEGDITKTLTEALDGLDIDALREALDAKSSPSLPKRGTNSTKDVSNAIKELFDAGYAPGMNKRRGGDVADLTEEEKKALEQLAAMLTDPASLGGAAGSLQTPPVRRDVAEQQQKNKDKAAEELAKILNDVTPGLLERRDEAAAPDLGSILSGILEALGITGAGLPSGGAAGARGLTDPAGQAGDAAGKTAGDALDMAGGLAGNLTGSAGDLLGGQAGKEAGNAVGKAGDALGGVTGGLTGGA